MENTKISKKNYQFNSNSDLNNENQNQNQNQNKSMVDQDSLVSPTSSQFQNMNSSEKKATHSEIEKRRRQKMNKHLNELVHHLPMSMSKSKKPDKITILKMALQHMKNLKASSSILSDSFLCQNYITPFELQSLVLKESEEFLIVIKCDSSKILYVSESCSNCIGFSSADLVDKVFFEIVHPSDGKQVKDQLTYHDLNNTIGSVSNFMLNKTRSYTTGDRRSFICRIRAYDPTCDTSNRIGLSSKTNSNSYLSSIQDHLYTNLEIKKPDYKIVHFSGYLRSDLNTNLKYNEFKSASSPGQFSSSSTILSPPSMATNSNESTSFLNTSMSSVSSTNSPSNNNQSNSNSKLNSFTNYHSRTLLNESLSASGSSTSTSASKQMNDSYSSSGLNDQNIHDLATNQQQQQQQTSSSATITSSGSSGNAVLQYYLIAYGQLRPKTEDSVQYKYVSRHDPDGKFIYLEPGVHALIGYLPHQLQSESLFNHVHTDDVNLLKKAFNETVNNTKQKIRTHEYRFKLENNTYVSIESVLYALLNPFSGQLEYIVAQNNLCSVPISFSNTNKYNNNNNNNNNNNQQHFLSNSSSNLSNQNSNLVSMPMTPSPEEIVYNNDHTQVNTDKLLNSSSNLSLSDLNDYSNNNMNKHQQKPQIQQNSGNMFNRSGSLMQQQLTSSQNNQLFSNNSNQVYQNQQQYAQPQQQTGNYQNYNMYNENMSVYRIADSQSFINTDEMTNYDMNTKRMNQSYNSSGQACQSQSQSQQQQADDSNLWMMQLFDNSDSGTTNTTSSVNNQNSKKS